VTPDTVNYDAFRVIAEVAVTLTGFIGIVVVLRHRDRPFSRLGLATILASLPVVGLKLAVGLGFLMPWAFEIYYLGLLWCVGIAAYLFAMILFDASDAEAAVPSTEG
jgi:hypothetical protein